MAVQEETHLVTLRDHLTETMEEANQLQTILGRAIQVLAKRGVHIQIDFAEMLRTLRTDLEKSQTSAVQVVNQSNQFQELVATSALLTSSLEFDHVLEKVLDTVIRLTGAERAYLLLKQGDGDELRVQAARNSEQETLTGQEVTFSYGIIKSAIDQRSPLVTTNAQDDSRFAGMKSVFVNELRSIIIVPLMLKDQVVGVLYADNRIEQGIFSQDNIPLLSAFANQAAIAISNARIFEKVRDDLKAAQRQVQTLLLEIDRSKVEAKVAEITETEYFKQLSAKATELRGRRNPTQGSS